MATITAPYFEVSIPSWLSARTISGDNLLLVLRSALITSDDSALYAPVAKYLAENNAVLLTQDITLEPDLISGKGEWLLYELHPELSR